MNPLRDMQALVKDALHYSYPSKVMDMKAGNKRSYICLKEDDRQVIFGWKYTLDTTGKIKREHCTNEELVDLFPDAFAPTERTTIKETIKNRNKTDRQEYKRNWAREKRLEKMDSKYRFYHPTIRANKAMYKLVMGVALLATPEETFDHIEQLFCYDDNPIWKDCEWDTCVRDEVWERVHDRFATERPEYGS